MEQTTGEPVNDGGANIIDSYFSSDPQSQRLAAGAEERAASRRERELDLGLFSLNLNNSTDAHMADVMRFIPSAAVGLVQSAGDLVDLVPAAMGYEGIPDRLLSAEARPKWARTDTAVGGLTSGIAQFAVPFGVAGAAGKAIGLAGKLTKGAKYSGYVDRYLVGGAIADGFAFSSMDGNLSNAVGFDPLANAQGDDLSVGDRLLNRAKNVVEGLAIGSTVGPVLDFGLGPALRGIVGGRAARKVSLAKTAEGFEGADEAFIRSKLIEAIKDPDNEAPILNDLMPQRARALDELTQAAAQVSETFDPASIRPNIAVMDQLALSQAALKGGSADDFYRDLKIEFRDTPEETAAATLDQASKKFITEKFLPRGVEADDKLAVDVGVREVAPKLPRGARKMIDAAVAGVDEAERRDAKAYVENWLRAHSPALGWKNMPIESVSKQKGKWKIKFAKGTSDFDFHINPETGKEFAEGPERRAAARKFADGIVSAYRGLQRRAEAGDTHAQDVLAESEWYSTMVTRVREAFGQNADFFTDLLGTLSPRTNVRDNFKYAVEAFARFARGEYDEILTEYKAWRDGVEKARAAHEASNAELLAKGATKKSLPKFTEPKFNDAFTKFDRIMRSTSYEVGNFDEKGRLLRGSVPSGAAKTKLPTVETYAKYHLKETARDEWLQRMRDANPELVAQGKLNSLDERLEVGDRIFAPVLFGINTRGAMDAMLDIWIANDFTSPKAPNFRFNLSGDSLQATIDVWAARLMQEISGRGRLPDSAEPSISGQVPPAQREAYRRGEVPATGAFGFAQTAFGLAAHELGMTAADLQAVAWFMQKEVWTRNGWTNKEGAGGSFDAWMDVLKPKRISIGITSQTMDYVPTDIELSKLGTEITDQINDMDGVLGATASVTDGYYGGYHEKSLAVDVVVQDDQVPQELFTLLSELGVKYRQESVLLSRTLVEGETSANARPGRELYFRHEQTPRQEMPRGVEGPPDPNDRLSGVLEVGRQLAEITGGFTVIKDPRSGSIRGIRTQYVPEFMGKADLDEINDRLNIAIDAIMRRDPDLYTTVLSNEVDAVVLGKGGTEYDQAQRAGFDIQARESRGADPEAGGAERGGQPLPEDPQGGPRQADGEDRGLGDERAAGGPDQPELDGELRQSPDQLNQSALDEEEDIARPRGRVTFEDGQTIITLFKGADASTVLHETGHILRRFLRDSAPDLNKQLEEVYGVRDDFWDIAAEERFAEDFETYVRTGQYATNDLKAAFDKLKEMLRRVYSALVQQELDGTMSIDPRVKDVLDQVFGSQLNRSNVGGRPSARTPNQPLPSMVEARDEFMRTRGKRRATAQYTPVVPERAKRIADAYDAMKHDPTNPRVKASYDKLKEEVLDQYRFLQERGYRFVFTRKDPYGPFSAPMIDDVAKNKRIMVFLTEPGSMRDDHPLAARTGEVITTLEGEYVKLSFNDVFRGVHDLFGHATNGFTFNAHGEESAWRAHAEMFSPSARMALTVETRGQNSWVNYGSHLRREDGSLPVKGDPDFVETSARPFAEQKVGLMPEWSYDLDAGSATEPEVLFQGIVGRVRGILKSGQKIDEALADEFNKHINFGRITDDAVLKEVFRAFEELVSDSVNETVFGGTKTMDIVLAEARAEIENPVEFLRKIRGEKAFWGRYAAKTVGLRMLRSALGLEIAKVAEQLEAAIKAGTNHKHLMEQLNELSLRQTEIEELVRVVQKDAAVSVQSGNIKVGGEEMEEAVRRLTSETAYTSEAAREAAESAAQQGNQALADYLEGVSKAGTSPRQVLALTRSLRAAAKVGRVDEAMRRIRRDPEHVAGLLDMGIEVWKAGLLSGARTVALNWGAPAVKTALLPAYRAIDGLVPKLFTDRPNGKVWDIEQTLDAVGLYGRILGAATDILTSVVTNPDAGPNARRMAKMLVDENILPADQVTGTELRRALTFDNVRGLGRAGRAVAGPEGSRRSAMVDGLGSLVRSPFRLNMIGEEVWKNINYLAFVRQQAYKEAKQAVRANPDPNIDKAVAIRALAEAKVRQAFDPGGAFAMDGDEFLRREAALYAKEVNFVQDLDRGGIGVSEKMNELRSHPLLQIVLPFFRVPANLGREAMRTTPGVGAVYRAAEKHSLKGNLGRKKAVQETPLERSIRDGQVWFGVAMAAFVANMVLDGRLTGGGPVNDAERQQLINQGWQPYSVVFTGLDGKKHYVAYNRFDPIAFPLGAIADAVESSRGIDDEQAVSLVKNITRNFGSKAYLRGSHELLRGFFQAEQYGGAYAATMLQSFVPNVWRSAVSANREFVPDLKGPNVKSTLGAAWQSATGIGDGVLRPRFDIFGQVVAPRGGYAVFGDPDAPISRWASPLAHTVQSDEVAYEELAKYRATISPPSYKLVVQGRSMDLRKFRTSDGKDGYHRYNELIGEVTIRGKTLKEAVETLVRSESYQSAPDPVDPNGDGDYRDVDLEELRQNPRVIGINRLITAYRQAAQMKLFEEVEDLRAERLSLIEEVKRNLRN